MHDRAGHDGGAGPFRPGGAAGDAGEHAVTGRILRRLAIGVFVLWGAVTLMFGLLRLAPGDPAMLLLGPDATSDEVASLRTSLGLDRSIVTQYVSYLGHAATLDLGRSFRFGEPATEVVFSRLQATVELTLTATIIAVVLGVVLNNDAEVRHEGSELLDLNV